MVGIGGETKLNRQVRYRALLGVEGARQRRNEDLCDDVMSGLIGMNPVFADHGGGAERLHRGAESREQHVVLARNLGNGVLVCEALTIDLGLATALLDQRNQIEIREFGKVD